MIQRTNDVAFGRARIAGTGITVDHIVSRFRAGESAKEIGDDYDLTWLQIEAALRYKLATPKQRRAIEQNDDD